MREASHQMSQQESQALHQKFFRNSLQCAWERGQEVFQITQKGKIKEKVSMQDWVPGKIDFFPNSLLSFFQYVSQEN